MVVLFSLPLLGLSKVKSVWLNRVYKREITLCATLHIVLTYLELSNMSLH